MKPKKTVNYILKERTGKENKEVINLIDDAKSKLQEAISEISYSYPEINSQLKAELEELVSEIEDIAVCIEEGDTIVYKPVKE